MRVGLQRIARDRPRRRRRLVEQDRNGDVALSIADDGGGLNGGDDGTGLSIVRALVRDELQGTLELTSEAGLCAQVVFPA